MFYCSVTQIKNWLLKDPLLDYLNIYGDKEKQVKPTFEECDFSTFIMDMGNKWEEHVVNILIDRCKSEGITYTSVDRKTGYHQTKNSIQQGIDLIFQAQVKDWNNNIVGYPDIIIKKKAFLKLFKTRVPELNNIKDNDYIVIDIKYSSVKGTGPTSEEIDNYIVEDSDYIRFIRGQILMYNRLGKFRSSVGFIISKDPATIDYPITTKTDDTELITDCNNAINWLKLLHESGKNIDVSSVHPNMNNTMDGYWREYKKELLGLTSPEKKNIKVINDIVYMTAISCYKFKLGEPSREYIVAVMVKYNDEIYFNLSSGLTFKDENNLLESLKLHLTPYQNKQAVCSGFKTYSSVVINNLNPERKGSIKNKMEICAVYNRNKLNSSIIDGIFNYCLEDCKELEYQYTIKD